jgi:hypothetical protein
MRRPEELLYDSEACLRLIDHVIEELGSSRAEMKRFAPSSPATEHAGTPTDTRDINPSSIDGGRALHRVTR